MTTPLRLLSWLLVTPIFVRLGDSSVLFASGRFLCHLVCRSSVAFSFVVWSLLFLFLSLLSSLFLFLSLSWSPFASLLLSLAWSPLRSHSLSSHLSLLFYSILLLFSFFVLSSLLATPVSFSFFLSFVISSVSWYLPLVVSWCSFGLGLCLCHLFISSLVLCFPFR